MFFDHFKLLFITKTTFVRFSMYFFYITSLSKIAHFYVFSTILTVWYLKLLLVLVLSFFLKLLMSEPLKIAFCQFAWCSLLILLDCSFTPAKRGSLNSDEGSSNLKDWTAQLCATVTVVLIFPKIFRQPKVLWLKRSGVNWLQIIPTCWAQSTRTMTSSISCLVTKVVTE